MAVCKCSSGALPGSRVLFSSPAQPPPPLVTAHTNSAGAVHELHWAVMEVTTRVQGHSAAGSVSVQQGMVGVQQRLQAHAHACACRHVTRSMSSAKRPQVDLEHGLYPSRQDSIDCSAHASQSLVIVQDIVISSPCNRLGVKTGRCTPSEEGASRGSEAGSQAWPSLCPSAASRTSRNS